MSATRTTNAGRRPRILARGAFVALCTVVACVTSQPPGGGSSTANAGGTGAGGSIGSPIDGSIISPPATDTAGRALVPPGFGTLRQDDLSFHVSASGLLVRALPLDESIIRLLTPDSYRAMRDLLQSNRSAISAVARRYGARPVSVWFVSFYGLESDAPFTPLDLMVTSSGRDLRPYDVIPLTTGFSAQRLQQRETQNALYIYDGDIELNQVVIVSYQGTRDDSWDQTLQRIERERALIRARAHKATTP